MKNRFVANVLDHFDRSFSRLLRFGYSLSNREMLEITTFLSLIREF